MLRLVIKLIIWQNLRNGTVMFLVAFIYFFYLL